MLRTALILLTLFLASCVSGSAEGSKQEAARPPSREAGLPYDVSHPTAFVCPPKLNPPRRPIPRGKKIDDLCPPGASALLFYDPVKPPHAAVIHPTTFLCFPQLHQQPRPIPPGKKIEDLCPPGKGRAWLFLDPAPPQTQAGTGSKSP